MGFPPPVDGPPPTPAGVSINVGLTPSLPAVALCGFGIPPIGFKFSLSLGGLSFPPAIPIPFLQLALNCDLTNPLSVNAGLAYGGGRTPNADPDPDYAEQAQSL